MHKNDNSADNALANLKWGTHGENSRDCVMKKRGGGQKLSPADVLAIRQRRAAGVPGVQLAAEYGVSQQRICDVFKGRAVF